MRLKRPILKLSLIHILRMIGENRPQEVTAKAEGLMARCAERGFALGVAGDSGIAFASDDSEDVYKRQSVASFTIASTPRTWNRNSNQFEDGQALFMRCSAWRDMAEHCAQSLSKGMRVIAQEMCIRDSFRTVGRQTRRSAARIHPQDPRHHAS